MNESRTEKIIRNLCTFLILAAITFGVAYLTTKVSGWLTGKSTEIEYMSKLFHPVKYLESITTNPTDDGTQKLVAVINILPGFLRLPIWIYLCYSLIIGANIILAIVALLGLGFLVAWFSPYYYGEVDVHHFYHRK